MYLHNTLLCHTTHRNIIPSHAVPPSPLLTIHRKITREIKRPVVITVYRASKLIPNRDRDRDRGSDSNSDPTSSRNPHDTSTISYPHMPHFYHIIHTSQTSHRTPHPPVLSRNPLRPFLIPLKPPLDPLQHFIHRSSQRVVFSLRLGL